MLDKTKGPEPIHYPANPKHFEFDAEVADIFDNMAQRSIPMYDEARRISVAVVMEHITPKLRAGQQVDILDVGCSTNTFFKTLWDYNGTDYDKEIQNIRAVAIDPSLHMTDKAAAKVPAVFTLCRSIQDIPRLNLKFDVINMAYVMQFVPRSQRMSAFMALSVALKPGGILIFSAKETVPQPYAVVLARQYIQFRLENGYTIEEIEAKTLALQDAMWTDTQSATLTCLYSYSFVAHQELCRWMQFSTIVATKQG